MPESPTSISERVTGMEAAALSASLHAMGLLAQDATADAVKLSGGVSCDVYRVDLPGGPVCVKRALPQLRVEAEWLAPPERSTAEAGWMRLAGKIVPGCAPEILGEDREHHILAMEYLDPATHPLWKARLADGDVDVAFAGTVGNTLARIHAATANREDIAASFANGEQFYALRIEPYLLFTAARNEKVAPQIRAMADELGKARIALMHGDVSPKNILMGPGGPVFLDAETACYGDPAFDLAFCLNHLLLKCVWHPEYRAAYLESFDALHDAYLAGVDWEDPRALDARASRLLGAFLLARIDGKSPVEYLTRRPDKAFVRRTAVHFLEDPPGATHLIARGWRAALSRR